MVQKSTRSVLDKSTAREHCWSNRVRIGYLKRAPPGVSDLNRRSVEQMKEIANEAGAAVEQYVRAAVEQYVRAAVEQYVKESVQRAKRVANDPAVRAVLLESFEVIRRSWLCNGSPAAA